MPILWISRVVSAGHAAATAERQIWAG